MERVVGGLLASGKVPRAVLAACAVGVGGYAVAALALPPGVDLARHVHWFLASFSFYLAAVVLVLAMERDARGGRLPVADLAFILVAAVLFRVALLATTPSLSDDVFRYVWDGKVADAGIDPYRFPPSAPELAHLRGPLWEGINHKSVPTPYPPLAEALFAAVYRLRPDSLAAMQTLAVALDLGIVALLIPMLAQAGLDPRRVLIYAWNPLVLVQFAHSGHYDAAMVLPLLGAIHLAAGARRAAAGALLGISTLVKLVPLVAAPLFVPLWGAAGLAAAGAVVAGGTVPWLLVGPGPAGVLAEAGEARFNDSLGYLLLRLLGLVLPEPETAARVTAAAALAMGALLLAGLYWRRGAVPDELPRAVYRALGLFLLLNAVVEPWYLTWMVPLLCFVLRATPRGLPALEPALGWLLLSGSIILTDLTYLPGVGTGLWPWVRLVEYGPLYALLAIAAGRAAAARRRPDSTPNPAPL